MKQTLLSTCCDAPAKVDIRWNEYFNYDDGLGRLIWRERPIGHFKATHRWKSWNVAHAGRVLMGSPVSKDGSPTYLRVNILGVYHHAHRIIWEMHNGIIPEGMVIDHADGNPHNNRIQNLRLCTQSQNASNGKRRTTNRSGARGVSWFKRRSMWRATVTLGGKQQHVGYFRDFEEARLAATKAGQAAHGEFYRA